MKKIFTLVLILVLFIGNTFSDSINKEEAQKIAKTFFKAYAPDLKSNSKIDKSFVEKYLNEESFYIFNFENGGFVIVSADDDATPILGYSFINSITEKIGSNTRYLFDCYNKEIADIKTLKIKDVGIKAEWEKLRSTKLTGKIKAVEPLLTTTWNQSPYYNEYCPTNTPVGCVATAMSQIMNYHEWPASGNGWHKYIPAEHPEYGVQYADFSSEVYDWANMPTSISSANDAVATICYHAGVAVNMNYATDGSGASTNDVLYALSNYFKYDPGTIEKVTYSAATETEYLNKIKTEIDANRPIYYDGYGDDGGHAWVCDGYDDADKVHINWGWGGSSNGYFLLSNMVAGGYDFTGGNSMIIGIAKGVSDQEMIWTKQASGFEAASRGIRYISAIDSRTAWAVAYDGSGSSADVQEYTRTIDGGSNWDAGVINAPDLANYNTSMISAIDESIAWVALFGPSGGGKIVKTIDGGQNWTHQSSATFSSPNGFPNVIHFWDANNGWCQGDPNDGYFEFYTTTDGGTTWNRVPEVNIPASQDGEYGTIGYYTVYGDIVWFATNKGRIYKSIDKGLNWVFYQTPITDASFELSFKDASTGIIQKRSDTDNRSYITTDGGENWAILNSTGNFYTNSFKYVPGENILISTGSDYETPSQGISYSTDDGATFTDYADFYQNYQFLSIGAASSDAIWAGGYNEDENNDGMWHLGDILISAGFTTNNTEYCASDDVVFTDESYGSPETWSWNFGDGASPATASEAGPHTVSYSTAGQKNITLTIDKGTDQHIFVRNEFIQIAAAIPSDAGTITGDATVTAGEKHTYSITNQDNVVFNWNITAQWTGSSTTNEIEIEFTGASGAGTIEVTPSNICGDGAPSSLDITADRSTGINDIDNDIISIYPNPTKDYFMVDGAENGIIYIYNSSGALVKTVNFSQNSRVNVSDLATGIYHVKLNINNNSYSEIINIVK